MKEINQDIMKFCIEQIITLIVYDKVEYKDIEKEASKLYKIIIQSHKTE